LSIFKISTIKYLYIRIITSIFIADFIYSLRHVLLAREIVNTEEKKIE